MNKKILIGSTIAVVILVLVSFTGVIGYQTTKSSTIAKVSPLFSIRTSRAIDEESKDLTCDYVGKGEESVLSIPSRDSKIELIQKVIDRVSKMDDKAFNKLIVGIVQYLKYQKGITDKEISDGLQIIYDIRANLNNIKYDNIKNNSKAWSGNPQALSCIWFPGCELIGLIIMMSLAFIILLVAPFAIVFCLYVDTFGPGTAFVC